MFGKIIFTYLDASVEPNVISPFTWPDSVVGLKEIAIDSVGMVFWANKLSVTVGTVVVPDTVPVDVIMI